MEITMTLTVTPEQAAAIAGLLAGSKPLNPPAPPLQSEPLPAPVAAPQPVAAPAPTAVPVNTAVPVQQEPLPTGIPTQVRAYSVNDLAIACRPLMEAGKQPELQALLAEFGAPAGLASVPENRRAEFAGRLRQMGGQI